MYMFVNVLFFTTDSDWLVAFHNHPNYNPATVNYDNLGDNCFDGTWLAALALNCTVAKLKEIG